MTTSFNLFRLQQIDSQIDVHKIRIAEIDHIIHDRETLMQLVNNRILLEQLLHAEKKQLHKAEEDVKAHHIKIEQTETTLYSGKITNPKELQDLQNESVALKKYLVVLEDRLLEAMIACDEAEENFNIADSKYKETSLKVDEQNQILEKESDNLRTEIIKLEKEKMVTVGTITKNELTLYESLRSQKKGIAVSRVVDKACSACGSELNAALLQSAKTLSQLARCDLCGRILYGG